MRVLITGATRGLGLAMTSQLLADGHQVVMTARDESRGLATAAELRRDHPGSELDLRYVDVSSPAAIDRLLGELVADGRPLDAVINNAGVIVGPDARALTPEGVELTLATNAFGPMRLTEGLAPLLSDDARVLALTSRLHLPGTRGDEVGFRFDDPDLDQGYSADRAYKNSKLALIWVCRELDRRLPAGVTCNAICPGFAPSTAVPYTSGRLRFVLKHVLPRLPFTVTVEQAAADVLWALSAPELVGRGGLYLADRKVAQPSEDADDNEQAALFWALAHQRWTVGSGS